MDNLNNSVRILENVLSTPGKSMLRSSKYIPKTSRHSLIRSNFLEESTQDTHLNLNHTQFDISATCAPHEFREIMGHNKLIRDPNLTFSESMLNGNILKTTQKSAEILDKLFTDFYEITQMHESAPKIFQTIADYIQTCSDNLDLVTDIQSKSLGGTRESAASEYLWLENERNLWRLIYCIYQDRLTSDKNPEIEPMPPNRLTEKQCVENLYRKDSLLRECQLVVDWLERNAADQIYGIPKMGHFTDKTVGWENTYHQLTAEDSTVFLSTRPIIKQLDPDAPYREKTQLHDFDLEDDKRFCRQIFYEVRCGRLDEAQSLCVHCGHPWRAALLEGWRLFHDPNYGKTENRSLKEPCEGNAHRDLWKFTTFKTCQDNRLNSYWRATLGALCGNLQPIHAVCCTWEDVLWAYLKVMIDIRVESEIRDTVLRKYKEMPPEYWKNRYSLDEIFNKLSDNVVNVGDDSIKYYSILRLIIMDQPVELLKLMKTWVNMEDVLNTSSSSPKKLSNSPQFLRLLAHIVLVYRQFGITGNELAGDSVLEQYVQCLIETNKRDLIAFYTATLPQPNQITMYSKCLESITDNTERRAMLAHAEEAGLHVEAITKQIVENIRRKDIITSISDLSNEITESDLTKISALDWLLFYDTQRLEAVYQTNAIIRYFLASGKLDAARQSFNKNPADTVDMILSDYTDNIDVPRKVQSILKEYLCYKAYLDGNETFSDWFHHFHHGRPKQPAPLSDNAGFTERVAHEHRVSQYNAELDRWKLTMAHRTKNTKTLLYNILLFPEGGWLVDTNDTDEARKVVLEDLRMTCIPKIVLLLHTVMHEMGEYKECVQLADLLADETKQLYKVFNRHVLGEVLAKICESSLALMDQKKDPWGYDVGT